MEVVIGKVAVGMSAEEVAQEYEITLDDLHAPLSYAASSAC